MRKLFFVLLMMACCFAASSQRVTVKQTQKNRSGSKPVSATAKKLPAPLKNVKVEIVTSLGNIVLQLSDSTPLHRDNFVALVQKGFYDSLLFHRVIPQFMVQGGDPTSKNAADNMLLGNGGSDAQRIPAEFNDSLFHQKGALGAARDNNPGKMSSPYQFYLVSGKTYTADELAGIGMTKGITFTEHQKEIYTTIGGTPFLDHNYTVFGQAISGLDVIDKIANLPRDANNRPLSNIVMTMRILK